MADSPVTLKETIITQEQIAAELFLHTYCNGGAIFAVYLTLTSVITYQNLYWDAEPFALVTDQSEIRRMFR